ncbi:VWA domain-containing protein [Acidobacteriota bacterium]
MKRTILSVFLAVLSLVILAQEIQHDVTVTLKLIQVMVTDNEGNPVTDLRKEDFSLFDNGQEQTLTEFEKHNINLPIVTTKPTKTNPLPVKPSLESETLLPRKFFLLFDFAWTDPQMVLKFRKTALDFLDENLLPTDEVSVLSYAGFRQLQVHFFQTTEHEQVRNYFNNLGLKDSSGRVEDLEESYQRGLQSGAQPDSRSGVAPLLPFPDVAADHLDKEFPFKAEVYLDSLTGLAFGLRYVPGQKHLVLISGGISPSIYGSFNLRYKAENLIKELNTSNVTIFSLRAAPMSMAPDIRAGAATLEMWAIETGGRYFGNFFKADEHVDRIKILTGIYYVLGYPVGETWDGKYHKIKVKVSRPGCKVQAQRGYFNPKTFSRYTKLEKEINLVDLALAANPLSQIPVRFPMTAQVCSYETRNNLLLAAHLPAESASDISEGKIEVISLVFNDRDEIIDQQRSKEDWSRLNGRDVYIVKNVSAPLGTYRCRIVIRDLETGKAGVAGFTTDVWTADGNEFDIFPPLLLRQKKGAFYVGMEEPTKRSKQPQPSSLINTSSYVPFLGRTLSPDSDVWVSIRCADLTGMDTGINLSAMLFDKTTVEEIPLPLEIIHKKEEKGMKTFLIRLQIPDIPKDEYTWIFTAEHIASGRKAETSSDFIISREETSTGSVSTRSWNVFHPTQIRERRISLEQNLSLFLGWR